MKNSKVIVSLILLFSTVAIFALFTDTRESDENPWTKTDNPNCISRIEERTVRGNSLAGLIESNSTVKILFGYYNCNEIKRGDVVAYNFSGDKNPIIKIVRGIPGDKLHLKEANGAWNILINGEALKNSKDEPYALSESGYKMLSLYEKDYKGIIPADAYLILGNLASGSLDSTRFGLVGKQDILGKVAY